MISFFAIAALAVLPTALAQGLMVNTPTGVVQCQPIQINWSGGTAPYFLSFIPAGQPGAPPIKQFPTQSGTSFTWTADLASGSTFSISIKDSTGVNQFSDIVTVQSGPDSSCINTSITEGGTGGAAAPTSGGSASSGAPASTTGASSSGGSSGSSSGSSKPTSGSAASTGSAPASSGSAAPNAASYNKGNALAVAGVMGLVGAALF